MNSKTAYKTEKPNLIDTKISVLILVFILFTSTFADAQITPAKIIYTPSGAYPATFDSPIAACEAQIQWWCSRPDDDLQDCRLEWVDARPPNKRAAYCGLSYINPYHSGRESNRTGSDLRTECPANTFQVIGNGYEAMCDDGCVAPLVGAKINGVLVCVTAPSPPKNDPDPSCKTPHPIAFTSGNKFLRETDYSGSGFNPVYFERIYNSTSIIVTNNQGAQWRNFINLNIKSYANNAFVYRAGGKMFTFTLVANVWKPELDITDKLTELKDANNVSTGWKYQVDGTGEIETYDVNGRLISTQDRAGNIQNMRYSCKVQGADCPLVTPETVTTMPGLLIQVTNHLGQSLNLTYDDRARIKTMTNPQGGMTTYTYSTDGNLSSVTYPDGKTKTYHYGETDYVSATPNSGMDNTHLLTGITDENGNRYATYYYDAQGRAYSEYLAGGADAASLTYNTDTNGNPTNTVVTDARGSNRTYNFQTILGVVKMTGQSQPAGSGCNASTSAMSYDANGNVASRTDFNGNTTTYVYNMARNLETSRTEGLTTAGAATPATRTITTTYHANWRLPLVISEYTGASATGTPIKTTTYDYDDRGNLFRFTEKDPVRTLSRTTTTTFTYSTAIPGLVLQKVVNGPRTDVTDVTTYVYYPHDATCTASTATPIIDPITGTAPANLGCRGQLQSVTNALGQITTYDRYNHHGQVEQMTDANGIVTTNEYDLRQRLLSRSVGNTNPETTTLVYDDAGQIIQLGMPNASTLSYTYDDAHRLIQIQDTLGNKVVYTLDAQGNRTQETLTDPLGNLTKTITRSYDALNRLQQVTGVE